MIHRVSTCRAWSFGDFLLDEGERRLTRCGVPVRLTPKGFDLLVALVERGGRLLRKHELMDRLWPDLFVGEGTLARHVSSLRQALGTGPSAAPWIQTVHKSGYRFVGGAREIPQPESVSVFCGACASQPGTSTPCAPA
jgi:DNA-binding winged helix-turn-helix (wHTH) protein